MIRSEEEQVIFLTRAANRDRKLRDTLQIDPVAVAAQASTTVRIAQIIASTAYTFESKPEGGWRWWN
jgi:hypothetical protein